MNDNFFEIAKNFENSREYARALEYYILEIDSNPKNALAYDGASMCFYNLKKFDDALDMSIKATEINPEREEPYLVRAYVYSYKNEFKNALNEAGRAFEKEPDSVNVLKCYGSLLLPENQVDKGISILEKALAIEPNSSFIHMNLAFGYLQKGDFEKHLLHSRVAFNLKPSIDTGFYLASAFENKYKFIIIIAVEVCILFTYITKSTIFLVVPILFIFYKAFLGVLAIKRRDLNDARKLGAILLLIISPIIYYLIFYQ